MGWDYKNKPKAGTARRADDPHERLYKKPCVRCYAPIPKQSEDEICPRCKEREKERTAA